MPVVLFAESENLNTAYDGLTDNNRLITIGGMVFEKTSSDDNLFLTNEQKPYATTVNLLSQEPKKGEIIVTIDLEFESEIASVSYEVT